MIQKDWSQLKVEAREAYVFRTANDPRNEWSINEQKAETSEFSGLVQYYKFEDEKLHCCICGVARHHVGAVVLLRDGSYRLVGNCCGKAHFQEQWQTSSNALSQAEREANYRKKARGILLGRSDVLFALQSLRRSCAEVDEARCALKGLLKLEYDRLALEIFRGAGRLSYEVSLGNALADQGANGSLSSTLADTDRLSGWELFSQHSWSTKLENLIGATAAAFDDLQRCLDKNHSLFAKIRKVQNLADESYALYESLNRVLRYGDAKNADVIDFWFEKKGIPFKLLANGNSWVLKTHSQKREAILPSLQEANISAAFQIFVREWGTDAGSITTK